MKWDVSEIVFLFFKLGRLMWNRCHFCSSLNKTLSSSMGSRMTGFTSAS